MAAPSLAQEGTRSELERTASTTPAEKRQYAVAANEEIRGVVRSLTRLVETARRVENAEVIDCLTASLTAARALQQVSEAAALSLDQALADGMGERADHEFRKIAIARTKARQLLADGERCASGAEMREGNTNVKWEGGLTEVTDDTRAITADVLDYGFDPPDVSPF